MAVAVREGKQSFDKHAPALARYFQGAEERGLISTSDEGSVEFSSEDDSFSDDEVMNTNVNNRLRGLGENQTPLTFEQEDALTLLRTSNSTNLDAVEANPEAKRLIEQMVNNDLSEVTRLPRYLYPVFALGLVGGLGGRQRQAFKKISTRLPWKKIRRALPDMSDGLQFMSAVWDSNAAAKKATDKDIGLEGDTDDLPSGESPFREGNANIDHSSFGLDRIIHAGPRQSLSPLNRPPPASSVGIRAASPQQRFGFNHAQAQADHAEAFKKAREQAQDIENQIQPDEVLDASQLRQRHSRRIPMADIPVIDEVEEAAPAAPAAPVQSRARQAAAAAAAVIAAAGAAGAAVSLSPAVPVGPAGPVVPDQTAADATTKTNFAQRELSDSSQAAGAVAPAAPAPVLGAATGFVHPFLRPVKIPLLRPSYGVPTAKDYKEDMPINDKLTDKYMETYDEYVDSGDDYKGDPNMLKKAWLKQEKFNETLVTELQHQNYFDMPVFYEQVVDHVQPIKLMPQYLPFDGLRDGRPNYGPIDRGNRPEQYERPDLPNVVHIDHYVPTPEEEMSIHGFDYVPVSMYA